MTYDMLTSRCPQLGGTLILAHPGNDACPLTKNSDGLIGMIVTCPTLSRTGLQPRRSRASRHCQPDARSVWRGSQCGRRPVGATGRNVVSLAELLEVGRPAILMNESWSLWPSNVLGLQPLLGLAPNRSAPTLASTPYRTWHQVGNDGLALERRGCNPVRLKVWTSHDHADEASEFLVSGQASLPG